MTQSLATTGVSTMTGSILGASGLVTAPGYAFGSATKTGFYLAGANQIGWVANGVQGATLNSDLSTTWAGAATFSGTVSAARGTIPIGTVVDFAGGVGAVPSGWLLCAGQLISTTGFAGLFAVLGTTYGSGAGTFGVPDYRGRTGYGQDNQGGTPANRITVAGLNFDGTVLGNSGGGQNQTLTVGQLPSGIASSGINTITVNSGATTVWQGLGGGSTALGGAGSVPAAVNPLTSSGGNTINVTSTNTSGNAHTILSPAIITAKIIYAGG
jgi:microcystin-dependent protein